MSVRHYFINFALILVLCLSALCYINFGSAFLFKDDKTKLSPKEEDEEEEEEEAISFHNLEDANNRSLKTILYWNSFFGKKDFDFGEGLVARHCPRHNNCFASHARNLEHVEKVDAIIFHGINDELNRADLPKKRHPQQRYIFASMESPINRYITPEFDNYFNLTMTYFLNSDIVWTYADVVDKNDNSVVFVPSRTPVKWKQNIVPHEQQKDEEQVNSIIKGKRKLAIWYRSNCETRSGRENYVTELEQHMTVSKFGACSSEAGCSRDKDCFKTDVEPNYFFYLSFENSLCDDYVTEKLFHALKYYVVPVVYGGANYSQFAPPNSFINALDFDKPKDLAKYLTGLSKNKTEYKKYFDWKNEYRIQSSKNRVICDLCEILNGEHRNSYKISKWYSAERCSIQRQLHKQINQGGVNYTTKVTKSNY